MRITGFILAFYLLALAIIPCCAFDECPDEKQSNAAVAGTSEQHENGDKDCGNCSPFFTCNGCSFTSIDFSVDLFELAEIKPKIVYTALLHMSLPTVVVDYWRPPQIA